MKNNIAAAIVGFVFAIGLGISGMTQPQKVIGFLDLFGEWDPSLVFVMLGAIAIHALAYKYIKSLRTPWFSENWHVPSRKDLTPALIVGAFIFGIGWGLGGYCPGPAITSLPSFEDRPMIFVVSMILGMLIFKFIDKRFNFKK